MKRLHSESKAARLYDQIKKVLFNNLCLDSEGEICIYGNENFVALNGLEAGETARFIEKCHGEINEIFASNGAVNIVPMHFGYFCTTSTEVPFFSTDRKVPPTQASL